MSKPAFKQSVMIVETVHPTVRYFVATPIYVSRNKKMPESVSRISSLKDVQHADVVEYGIVEVEVDTPESWRAVEQDAIAAIVKELGWTDDDITIQVKSHPSGSVTTRELYSDASALENAVDAHLITV